MYLHHSAAIVGESVKESFYFLTASILEEGIGLCME